MQLFRPHAYKGGRALPPGQVFKLTAVQTHTEQTAPQSAALSLLRAWCAQQPPSTALAAAAFFPGERGTGGCKESQLSQIGQTPSATVTLLLESLIFRIQCVRRSGRDRQNLDSAEGRRRGARTGAWRKPPLSVPHCACWPLIPRQRTHLVIVGPAACRLRAWRARHGSFCAELRCAGLARRSINERR